MRPARQRPPEILAAIDTDPLSKLATRQYHPQGIDNGLELQLAYSKLGQLAPDATACSLVSIFFCPQRLQRPMQQFPPQFFFLFRRNIRVSDDVDNAVT